jgi:hypothetical protein
MNNNCLNILDAILACDYLVKNRDLIISIFYDTFFNRKSQIFVTIKYNKVTDSFDKILVVKFPVSVSLQGNNYEVSILTYFPKLFPAEAPLFYIERTEPIGVNVQSKILNNKTLQVITPGITRWSLNNSNSNVNEIINEITKEFNLIFPVYKLDKNSKTIDYGEECRLINDNLQIVSFDAVSKIDTKINKSPRKEEKIEKIEKIDISSNLHSFDDFNFSNISNKIPQKDNYFNNSLNNNNTNSSTLFNDEKIKTIYKQALFNKLKSKILNERRKLKQEEKILNTYKSTFLGNTSTSINCNGLKEFASMKEQIISSIHSKNQDLVLQAQKIKTYINSISSLLSQDKIDYRKFITIDHLHNETLHLICKVCVLEDLLVIIKKGFEKKIFDLSQTLKLIRSFTKEIMIIKYCINRNLKKDS